MTGNKPIVFISYSHDDSDHKNWVRQLGERLKTDGVDVRADFFDLKLGQDLPQFMERGTSNANRVLAICSENYVAKANSGISGVGYEKMILCAEYVKNMSSIKIIPMIRNNLNHSKLVPIFLESKLYTDFRDDSAYELKYKELLLDIRENTPFFPSESIISTQMEEKGGIHEIHNESIKLSQGENSAKPLFKLKRNFSEVLKKKFIRDAYVQIHKFFKGKIDLLDNEENVDCFFKELGSNSFSCTINNKFRSDLTGFIRVSAGPDAQGMGDLTFSNYDDNIGNSAIGTFQVRSDEYALFFEKDLMSTQPGNDQPSINEIAEYLWKKLLDQAGIEQET